MHRIIYLLGVALVFAGLSVAAPAVASNADSPAQARTHMRGGCVHNTETHVLDCIKGWHRFHHRVNGHRKAFWEPIISAQRCKASGCWGRIWSGTQPRKYKLGAKGIRRSFADLRPLQRGDTSGCGGVFSPWAICWFDRQLNKGVEHLNQEVTYPCVFGTAKGFAGIAVTNIAVKGALVGGYLTAAQAATAATYFTGPVGIGIISMATCGIGIAEKGISHVEDLFVN